MTTLGAIYYPGWFAPKGSLYVTVLAPDKWDARRPFYIPKTGSGTASGITDAQLVIDAQCDQSNASGIDYWAHNVNFAGTDLGGNGNAGTFASSASLLTYLSSTRKGRLKFSLVLIGSYLHRTQAAAPSSAVWSGIADQIAAWCAMPEFMTVLSGRPLIYFFDTGTWRSALGDSDAATAITTLRNKITDLGAGDPYIVCMGSVSDVVPLGLDAVGNYYQAKSGTAGVHYSNAYLRNDILATWAYQVGTGHDVVPLVSSGFDWEPNVDTVLGQASGESSPGAWYTEPTPAELAAQIADPIDATYAGALAYMAAHSASFPADTMLIYAIGENAEGGHIDPCPLGDKGMKLQLIAQARKTQREPGGRRLYRSRGIGFNSR